jgi:S1-C subfamily serine protease
MPLSEIRLENTEPALGGALLFNLDGQFAGALNATLESPPGQNNFPRNANTGAAGFGGGGANTKIIPENVKADLRSQFGPGAMATAYTIGPNVLRRVIEGFRSPNHEVHHPTIGIFCKDAVPVGGALIEIVSDGSNAQKAGLRKGDVIYSINNQAVRSQFDFARIMIDQEIGNKLQIWVSRDNLRQMIEVTVGAGVIKS